VAESFLGGIRRAIMTVAATAIAVGYCVMHEFIGVLGEEKMQQMFFGSLSRP